MNHNGDELVGGRMFQDLQVDDRVTKDLAFCLYCTVTTSYPSKDSRAVDRHKSLDYKIGLDCISGDAMKQCPACKRIYILGEFA